MVGIYFHKHALAIGLLCQHSEQSKLPFYEIELPRLMQSLGATVPDIVVCLRERHSLSPQALSLESFENYLPAWQADWSENST